MSQQRRRFRFTTLAALALVFAPLAGNGATAAAARRDICEVSRRPPSSCPIGQRAEPRCASSTAPSWSRLDAMNLYDATIPIFVKMLHNVESWLDKTAAFAAQKKVEPDLFLQFRLAPDQYPLVRQIQAACDTAKLAAAKMTGKEAPSHPDTEKTFDELRARLQTCIQYLESFKPEDFAGCEDRAVGHQWMGGKTLRAGDYLDHFVLPNFHFHLTIAYQILRHNGVDVGKLAFLGSLPFQG